MLNVTEFGSTKETIAIAEQLNKDSGMRKKIINLLEKMDIPISYSNQDIDREAYLAKMLGDVLRDRKKIRAKKPKVWAS